MVNIYDYAEDLRGEVDYLRQTLEDSNDKANQFDDLVWDLQNILGHRLNDDELVANVSGLVADLEEANEARRASRDLEDERDGLKAKNTALKMEAADLFMEHRELRAKIGVLETQLSGDHAKLHHVLDLFRDLAEVVGLQGEDLDPDRVAAYVEDRLSPTTAVNGDDLPRVPIARFQEEVRIGNPYEEGYQDALDDAKAAVAIISSERGRIQ